MKCKFKNKGFTLIELMIVVALIGILAAFAIPTYNDYITRSQVSEAIELFTGVKTSLYEYASSEGSWPKLADFTSSNGTGFLGIGANQIYTTLEGKYAKLDSSVASFNGASYPNGQITVTMKSGQAKGQSLTFSTVDGGVIWACGNTTTSSGVTNTNTTISKRWLPTTCKD